MKLIAIGVSALFLLALLALLGHLARPRSLLSPPRARTWDISLWPDVTMRVTLVPDGVPKSMTVRVAVDGDGKVQGYRVEPAPRPAPGGTARADRP